MEQKEVEIQNFGAQFRNANFRQKRQVVNLKLCDSWFLGDQTNCPKVRYVCRGLPLGLNRGEGPPSCGGGRVPIVEDTCGRWRSSSNHLHTIGMRSSVDLSTPRLSSHKRFNPSQAKLNLLSQNIRSRFLRLFVCLAVSSVKPLTPSFGFPSSHCWRGVTFSPAAGLMWAGGWVSDSERMGVEWHPESFSPEFPSKIKNILGENEQPDKHSGCIMIPCISSVA